MDKKIDPKAIVQFWNSRKKSDKLLILLALGLLMVIIMLPDAPQEETEPENSSMEIQNGFSYEASLESRLEDILSGIQGVGEVEVMVTLKSSGEKVVQMDTDISRKTITETDSSGGNRTQQEVTQDSDTLLVGGTSSGEPYVVQEIMPQVEGVIVLADGGEKATVRSDILDAVQALFSLEAHKIKVFRRD